MRNINKLFLLFFIGIIPLINNNVYGQRTYTTTSKSCGSCGSSVSSSSTIGMRCPHCGVRWGYENQTYSKSKINTYNNEIPSNRNKPNYKYIESYTRGEIVYPKATINIRSGPSTNYSILKSVSNFEILTIVSRSGDWYYISYSQFNDHNYQLETKYGYVAGWLIKSEF